MTDDSGFDPTKKKKKKKKFEGLDDDTTAGTETDATVPSVAAAAASAPAAPPAAAAAAPDAQTVPEAAPAAPPKSVELEDSDLDLTAKKKKKKKKVFEALDDDVPTGEKQAAPAGGAAADDAGDADGVTFDSGAPAAVAPASAPAPAAPTGDDEGGFDAALPGKKKKKKKLVKALDDLDLDDDGPSGAGASAVPSGEASADADRELSYDELLDRVFGIIRQKNPEMGPGERRQMVIKPPQVQRLGTRRTAFANFTEYAKMLRRPADHLQNFLVAELGASGSVDGSAALVIRGRFQQKQIENVLRKYIREYVTCHTCKSAATQLEKEKESRLFFLKCETCGSRCSVANIRAGFQAITSKRAAMRAKEG